MSARYESDEAQLFDAHGQRKYLHTTEAKRLLAAAARADRQTQLFCQLLYYTGCRLSEALALTPKRLDREDNNVVFRTLKRRKLIYRAVPVPARLMRDLAALSRDCEPEDRIFPWSRQTGWRRIKALMDLAAITGPQATPKGLRHQFGIRGVDRKVSESAIGRWLGHANPTSTRIYTRALGAEERALAKRMW